MSAPDVLGQIPEFVRTHGLGPEFFEFLGKLARQHPDHAARIALFGVFLIEPERSYRLFQGLQQLDAKIAAAGFADHPVDYLWRPILAKVLTLTECKEGVADLGDIIEANDALDRQAARQRRAAGLVSPKEVAHVRALELLHQNPAAKRAEVSARIAAELHKSPKYIGRLIQPIFQEWDKKRRQRR